MRHLKFAGWVVIGLVGVVSANQSGFAQQQGDQAAATEPNVEAVGGTSLPEASTQSESSAETADEQQQQKKKNENSRESESEFDASGHFTRASRAARRGSYDYAINLFQEVLKKAPLEYPEAHYNLANLYEAKRKLSQALLHYQAYVHTGDNAATLQKAKKGVESAIAQGWSKRVAHLSVDIQPDRGAQVYLNGFLFATGGDINNIRLHSGEYEIWGTATDHTQTEKKSVSLEMQGSASVQLRPQRKIFEGRVMVDVDQSEAQIRLKPRSLKTERAEQPVVTKTSPLSDPVTLVTGEYLLEVTKDDYHRWVRYIDVRRNDTTRVQVEMSEKLPAEIR